MKRVVIFVFLLYACCLAPVALLAQGKATISDAIVKDSSGRVTIDQPAALYERLKPENGNESNGEPKKAATVHKNVVGYRIQVFSDNNHRTAKNEALIKERNIRSRFPQLGTYIQFKAPAWRLRVGDFATRGEAREMLMQIRRAFPAYASEMTVVMDKINPAAL